VGLCVHHIYLHFCGHVDTLGTIAGLAAKLNILKEDGSFEGADRALITDAVGTMVGAVAGTSTVTTYVESAAVLLKEGKQVPRHW